MVRRRGAQKKHTISRTPGGPKFPAPKRLRQSSDGTKSTTVMEGAAPIPIVRSVESSRRSPLGTFGGDEIAVETKGCAALTV
ncbi:hypothetical protein N7510_010795 [Penicillium lagena]|uniref:uncharacterized protein n=1 Tax=Penicillium lagena TaxID=94218 RepID=UPI0025403A16|nr:uncharacterized protein N7510_010795 [Penicillium lagena]KAJ5601261.1 hypothetical protein N7510_010795 [Penicillium lagena]